MWNIYLVGPRGAHGLGQPKPDMGPVESGLGKQFEPVQYFRQAWIM